MLKREEHAVEVGNAKSVSSTCKDKSAKEGKGSVETLCNNEIKKKIEDKEVVEPTNKQLCKYNNGIERETCNNVPRGPQKAAVKPSVTKQRKESENCVYLDETDGKKSKANGQQGNAVSKIREQGARPKGQRAMEPSGAGQKTCKENHGDGNKISSSADKSVVQIQKGCSGASGRTSNTATAKRTSQIYSKVTFSFLSPHVVFKSS